MTLKRLFHGLWCPVQWRWKYHIDTSNGKQWKICRGCGKRVNLPTRRLPY